MKEVKSHYEDLSDNYDKKVNIYCQHRFIDILKKHIEKGKRILEVGCATGYVQNKLDKGVIGIDLTHSLLKKNKSKVVCADALSIPFRDNSFDFVYSVNVLEHMDNPDKMIKECKRAAKKNGKIILITPNGDMEFVLDAAEKLKLKLPEGPHKFLGFKELQYLVRKNGLKIDSAERFVFVPFNFPLATRVSEKLEKYIPSMCLFQAIICSKE